MPLPQGDVRSSHVRGHYDPRTCLNPFLERNHLTLKKFIPALQGLRVSSVGVGISVSMSREMLQTALDFLILEA